MEGLVKVYYLLQFSYWLQQMLVLILRLEKPRSDFNELVIHHCVTLWLVGWSYAINLTMIGTAIFVSMDVPDVFLVGANCYRRPSGALTPPLRHLAGRLQVPELPRPPAHLRVQLRRLPRRLALPPPL